ncbi:MAG TPA: segregation/condensation protein A [Firmicutes bacterium]|jgi:segregation and condensation protein A|nr:segregation/condensation protein A [Bacillota bacterium]
MIPNENGVDRPEKGLSQREDAGSEIYTIRLPVFEGPFELLYHLIKKEEINIWDISLAGITEEYLAYLRSMEKLEADLAGSFLVMSANLLFLKSRMLLPKLPQEDGLNEEEFFFFGSKEELVHRMLEYSRFKEISRRLKLRETALKKIYLRPFGLPAVVVTHRQVSLYPSYNREMLRGIYQALLEKKKKEEEKNIVFTFFEENTLLEKIKSVFRAIKKMNARKFFLEKLLGRGGKKEIVATFFAILELARRGKIFLDQKKLFDSIEISLTEKVKRG